MIFCSCIFCMSCKKYDKAIRVAFLCSSSTWNVISLRQRQRRQRWQRWRRRTYYHRRHSTKNCNALSSTLSNEQLSTEIRFDSIQLKFFVFCNSIQHNCSPELQWRIGSAIFRMGFCKILFPLLPTLTTLSTSLLFVVSSILFSGNDCLPMRVSSRRLLNCIRLPKRLCTTNIRQTIAFVLMCNKIGLWGQWNDRNHINK